MAEGNVDGPAPVAAASIAEVKSAIEAAAIDSVSEPEPEMEEPEPVFVQQKALQPRAETPAAEANKSASGSESPAKESLVASQSIRVSVELLENLMVTVSELVLTRNQLMQISRGQKDSPFAAPLQRLNHVTSELQEDVMRTRMQPIGNAWAKLPRIVRDLSLELGKKIDLQMLGADTELDRQVLELIKDPLTHMVRNSADHGIEMPAERIKAGKPEIGNVVLNAYHEGGHIVIEISDDGKGLAIEAIKAKVVQNGLASEMELASMSDQQIMQFIFKPGFSTATRVTSVSGRGVGMDVVRTNIEKIGGTIDMQSTRGKGSRFRIKIPLTLAIVSALIVECAGERFAIPQISVVELVHASATSEYRVERINDTPVLRLRNRLLPLVSLRTVMKLGDAVANESESAFIVVIQVGSSAFGIIVDRVFDTEEIVVKPVAPILRNISLFSGNTILGDGSVVMILDPNGIASRAGKVHTGDQESAQHAAQVAQAAKADGRQSLLLFRAGGEAPKAVPLSLVARLEEIDLKTVEYSDHMPVVQYRGKLMPLVPIEPNFNMRKEGSQPILVFSDQSRSMGLMVDEIIDIVEARFQVDLSAKRPGCLGSAIITGKATDVVDTGHYLAQAYQDWFGVETEDSFGQESQKKILLIDDSPFFRNLLAPLLTVAGYSVTPVENPIQALKLQEAGEDFDVIISDIEMPEMNGFDFVTKVRGEGGRWAHTPMIAMSSHATPRDFDRGRQVGFTDYVAKFNREGLLDALRQSLNETRVNA
ncbi:MAG: chemotaxis protein CheW [Alphaproteobacteria bacterium]|nr:chemotaxis protein CheW [Alphaproteobacteria bacterium]